MLRQDAHAFGAPGPGTGILWKPVGGAAVSVRRTPHSALNHAPPATRVWKSASPPQPSHLHIRIQ